MPEANPCDIPDGDQEFEPMIKPIVKEGATLVRAPTFRYSKCNGDKKAVCVSFFVPFLCDLGGMLM